MMLSEVTGVPQAALPVADFKDHLRLGTGFADDSVQDALAESYLRAAVSAIEGGSARRWWRGSSFSNSMRGAGRMHRPCRWRR